jgi:hypothetical protein
MEGSGAGSVQIITNLCCGAKIGHGGVLTTIPDGIIKKEGKY